MRKILEKASALEKEQWKGCNGKEPVERAYHRQPPELGRGCNMAHHLRVIGNRAYLEVDSAVLAMDQLPLDRLAGRRAVVEEPWQDAWREGKGKEGERCA